MVQRAIASASRVFGILDAPLEITDAPDAIELTGVKGHIVFDRVTFTYDDKNIVLQDVSFEVLPGQKVGIVGPSGAGKSTILALILRLYEPQEGRILLDWLTRKSCFWTKRPLPLNRKARLSSKRLWKS